MVHWEYWQAFLSEMWELILDMFVPSMHPIVWEYLRNSHGVWYLNLHHFHFCGLWAYWIPFKRKMFPLFFFFWNYGSEYLVFLCICAHMNVNTPICTLCRWFLWGGFFLFVCLGFFCGFLKKINNLQLSTEDERALQMEQNLV